MARRRLPPEWAPQRALLLTWPHADSDWRDSLALIEPVYADIAARVSPFEPLVIACRDAAHQRHVARLLAQAGVAPERVELYIAASNDVWARDYGPVTVFEGAEPVLLDFAFNGWGNKYPCAYDARLTRRLHDLGAFPGTRLETIDFVLEGGSIDGDGAGTLLTTARCLLAPTRNPGYTRPRVEALLSETLGVERVLWLTHGYVAGDDTDGHVDMLARFCDPQTIAYLACEEPDDEHYAELKRMERELASFETARGGAYRLVPLPLPRAKHNERGERLPASYANFLIVNRAVLVPTYGDPADEIALARIGACFPERATVGVPSLPLIAQYGSLHCATMQLPAHGP